MPAGTKLSGNPSIADARGHGVHSVTLALEGGGALGAFAWGVIERLLGIPELKIAAVSGASAGAMNAALLVQGLARGSVDEAKRLLETFWRRVAGVAGSSDLAATPWLRPLAGVMALAKEELRQQLISHHPISPLAANPLRPILEELLDPSCFEQEGAPMLVVSATRVRTGEARLFLNGEVSVDALLASSCLPQLFRAVEIDSEYYWDGGYASNPPIQPLVVAGAPSDIIIVRTTPVERPETPLTQSRIAERANEIAFSAALRREMRGIAVAQHLLAGLPSVSGVLARFRDARLHMIGADEAFRALKPGSHLDPTWGFLVQMRELGFASAEQWLQTSFSSLGASSTVSMSTYASALLDSLARARQPTSPEQASPP
jgi:NTE family protein